MAPALVVIPDLREIQINNVQNLLPVVAAPLLHYVVAAISLLSNDDHLDFDHDNDNDGDGGDHDDDDGI